MEGKQKFMLIGLIAVSLIFLLLFLQATGSKQGVIQERDTLKSENESLNGKITSLESSLRHSEDKLAGLNQELEQVSQDKLDIEGKYQLANRQIEELMEKMKSKGTQEPLQQQAQPRAVSLPPQTSDAYWAGVLREKTNLELQLSGIRDELRTTKIANEQIQREKKNVELELANLKKEKDDLKRDYEYNKKVMDSISQELVRERSDKLAIKNSFKTMKVDNESLSRQLNDLNMRKVDLEKRIQQLEKEKSGLENKFNDMEIMLTDRISQIDQLKEKLDAIRTGRKVAPEPQIKVKEGSVDLPAIVVRPEKEYSPAQQPRRKNGPVGKVKAVNKEYNFVVVDIGEESGVGVGDTMRVYRDGNPIASIEVIRTQRDVSACDIRDAKAPILEDDIVK